MDQTSRLYISSGLRQLAVESANQIHADSRRKERSRARKVTTIGTEPEFEAVPGADELGELYRSVAHGGHCGSQLGHL